MIGERLPPRIERLTETTFKPLTDRWIAYDGAAVVLKAGSADAVILRHDGLGWVCTRHVRTECRCCSSGDATRLTHWTWRGASYLVKADEIARFDESDGPGPWTELYETLLAVRSDCASWPGAMTELVPA